MSEGQHIGRLSDSLTADEERSSSPAAMKRLMRPTNKSSGPKVDVANGDPCPRDPSHGKMFVLPSGTHWCTHSDHTAKRKATNG